MARKPIAGMVDKNVPSQLDPEDLAAEVELEVPGSMDNVVSFEGMAEGMDIEISPEEDGGVTIDFEPEDQRGMSDDFYLNLAEEMPEPTNRGDRSGKMLTLTVWSFWDSIMKNGRSPSGEPPGSRTRCLPRRLRNFRRRRSMSCCLPAAPCELLLWEAKQGKSRPSRSV